MADSDAFAYSAFLDFSSEMKRWNEKYFPLMSKDAAKISDQAAADLEIIFDRYVWPEAARRAERLNRPSVSQPSDYDPENDTIEDIKESKSKTTLYVQAHTGFKDRFSYTMMKKSQDWKLFRRDVFDDISEKWKSYHI